MSKRLDENLGTVGYDGLIVTNEPVADVVTVTLAASQGVLARGTVITGTAGGEMSAAAAALAATQAVYILADETDTGTGTGAAVTATAYRTGHFARNKLSTNGSYTLVAADEEIMRNAGILLSDALDY
jgi:hypothetical protein